MVGDIRGEQVRGRDLGVDTFVGAWVVGSIGIGAVGTGVEVSVSRSVRGHVE